MVLFLGSDRIDLLFLLGKILREINPASKLKARAQQSVLGKFMEEYFHELGSR
ncbi:hypothetical protein NOC27_1013 [Nitrosococcus oceani AFC27]|nr:hypothetical protein NOC27_1013 [Nitrosococcus oceani AFC27]